MWHDSLRWISSDTSVLAMMGNKELSLRGMERMRNDEAIHFYLVSNSGLCLYCLIPQAGLLRSARNDTG